MTDKEALIELCIASILQCCGFYRDDIDLTVAHQGLARMRLHELEALYRLLWRPSPTGKLTIVK